MRYKNEEREKKSGAGIRTSQWLWIVDLFGDYNHFPVGLTRFLKQFIRPGIFTYGIVWRLKRKEIFAIKVFRERIKEDEK